MEPRTCLGVCTRLAWQLLVNLFALGLLAVSTSLPPS